MESVGDKTTVLDEIASYELARTAAMDVYNEDPRNVDNLTMWGSALLELSRYQRHSHSQEMIRDAVSKFEEALSINPRKSDTIWCLGNAKTALAYLSPYAEDARRYSLEANQHFKMACEAEPDNELYRMSLHMVSKGDAMEKSSSENHTLGCSCRRYSMGVDSLKEILTQRNCD